MYVTGGGSSTRKSLKHTPRHTYSLYSLYTSLFSSYCPSDFIPHRITIMFTIPQTRLPRNIQLFRKRLSEKMCTRQSRKVIAELRRAKRASGAPWVRKFGYDVAYARTLLRGREGNQVSARPGEEYVVNRAMHLCNPPFSWREIAQEMAWLSSRSKTCLLPRKHVLSFCMLT